MSNGKIIGNLIRTMRKVMLVNVICNVIDFKCFDHLRVHLGFHQRVSLIEQNKTKQKFNLQIGIKMIKSWIGCLPCRRFHCRTQVLSASLSPLLLLATIKQLPTLTKINDPNH